MNSNTPLTETVEEASLRRRWRTLLTICCAALALSLGAFWRASMRSPSIVNRDTSTLGHNGVLRVGYGGFPPYTIVDPRESNPNEKIKGFSVDVVKEIAKRHVPPLKIEWYNFSWDAMKADMATRKFEFIADPVFQTIPRAADFALSKPYSYFGIAVAIVRKDENRFKEFSDLDRPDIVISLAEGWTSSEYAQQHLTKPKFKMIPVSGDAFNQLDEVLLGRVDVALNDVPTVVQYARAHADAVKALWIANPPSRVPGGFLAHKEDLDTLVFLNTAIEILEADGTLARLDEKWKTFGFLPEVSVRPGRGISDEGR